MSDTYIEEFHELWTERAQSYSGTVLSQIENGTYVRWLEEALRDIPKDRRLKVLDVGCGPGFFSVILGRLGHDVTGIDYNEEMCRTATENCDSYGVPATFLTMDAHNLEFEDGSFDLVVSRDVLWNLDDPGRVYEEMLRILRPGGKLTVFDGNFYLYAHDRAYESMNVERHIEIYHKDEPDCRERLLRVADMATRLPAAKERRPQWDAAHLISLGASRVSTVSYPDNMIQFCENGRTAHLPFIFAVSAFKKE